MNAQINSGTTTLQYMCKQNFCDTVPLNICFTIPQKSVGKHVRDLWEGFCVWMILLCGGERLGRHLEGIGDSLSSSTHTLSQNEYDSQHRNRSCHSWSRCNGVLYVWSLHGRPIYVNTSRTYSDAPTSAVTGTVFTPNFYSDYFWDSAGCWAERERAPKLLIKRGCLGTRWVSFSIMDPDPRFNVSEISGFFLNCFRFLSHLYYAC